MGKLSLSHNRYFPSWGTPAMLEFFFAAWRGYLRFISVLLMFLRCDGVGYWVRFRCHWIQLDHWILLDRAILVWSFLQQKVDSEAILHVSWFRGARLCFIGIPVGDVCNLNRHRQRLYEASMLGLCWTNIWSSKCSECGSDQVPCKVSKWCRLSLQTQPCLTLTLPTASAVGFSAQLWCCADGFGCKKMMGTGVHQCIHRFCLWSCAVKSEQSDVGGGRLLSFKRI